MKRRHQRKKRLIRLKLLVGKLALNSILVNVVKFILFNTIVAWIIAYIYLFCGGFLQIIFVKQNPTTTLVCATVFNRTSVLSKTKPLKY